MKTRVARSMAVLLAVAALVAPASGFDLSRSTTEAGMMTTPAGAQMIHLQFVAELINGLPDLMDDVEVGWQEVGGIEPVPFRILIPAGCFMERQRGGYAVEDFAACGVELAVGSAARGATQLEIMDFDARVAPRDDGTHRFDLATSFIPPDPIVPPDPIIPPDPVHAFLGIVGGAAVRIVAGNGMSASPPLRSETVSGVEPTPF